MKKSSAAIAFCYLMLVANQTSAQLSASSSVGGGPITVTNNSADTIQTIGVTTYPIVVDIIEPTAPNFKAIFDESHFVLYSVGPDGKKDWAKNIREDVSEVFDGDYLIWPPTIALYRQHMREIGRLQ